MHNSQLMGTRSLAQKTLLHIKNVVDLVVYGLVVQFSNDTSQAGFASQLNCSTPHELSAFIDYAFSRLWTRQRNWNVQVNQN